MHIKKLKVRPRKDYGSTVCAAPMAAMLGCWAAHKDVHSMGPCQTYAKALYDCMKSAPPRKKQPGSAINYHLMRLGKYIQ